VRRCLVPAAAGAFYLYTTPPRQRLKDEEQSLYRAQLVPAANVHVHVEEARRGWLGPARLPACGRRGWRRGPACWPASPEGP
jgi:hypothetical protein